MNSKQIFLVFMLFLYCCGFAGNSQAQSHQALVLSVSSTIGPAEQHYIERGIKEAQAHDNNIIILKLNSTGGSLRTIRRINELFLLTPIPIVTYVAPEGAVVLNESLSLLYASHLTAMAPRTHIGITDKSSETDDEIIKQIQKDNQFAAYLRSLAYFRGRNAEWAESSVRQTELLNEKSAYEKKVIDEIATDLQDLLKKLDGHRSRLNGVLEELDTKALVLTYFPPDLQYRLSHVLMDPLFIYVLIFISVYIMMFEFTSPIHLSFLLFLVALGIFLLAFYLMHFWSVHYFSLIFIVGGILLNLTGKTTPVSLMWKIPGLSLFSLGSYLLFSNTSYVLHPGVIAIPVAILVLDIVLKIKLGTRP